MRFITIEDIRTVCDEKTVDVIMQSEESNLSRAEEYAVEEISGYLRSRYDILSAYQKEDTERNRHLVMITCDVMIYHLITWLPARMAMETRKQRYDDAIKWCQRVQDGKCSPDLPTYSDGKNQDLGSSFRAGSMKPNSYSY